MELSQAGIEEKAEQLYDYVMRFIKSGRTYSEIKQFLMDGGMDEITVKAVIKNVLLLEKKKAKIQMKNGAILVSIGVVATILSYMLTSRNQPIYLIVYGPVIVGIVMILRGYSKYK